MSLTRLQKIIAAQAILADLLAEEQAAQTPAAPAPVIPQSVAPASVAAPHVATATMAAPPSKVHVTVPPAGVQKSRPFPAGAKRVNQQ